jgi:hypothetical protein
MEYVCISCGEKWGSEILNKERMCPFCSMPSSQAITDIFLTEGREGVIEYIDNVIKHIEYDEPEDLN